MNMKLWFLMGWIFQGMTVAWMFLWTSRIYSAVLTRGCGS